MKEIIMHSVDWTSVKLCGVGVGLSVITWNVAIGILSGVALLSTIVYNGIRIYKEVKKKP
jgi:hypothetical protein